MLKNSLINIPQIVLLRSDKIFVKLLEELQQLSSIKLKDNFTQLTDGVRDFYPNSYRLDEIELSLAQKELVESGVDVDYTFSFLGKLFDEFLTFDGSFIYAKEESLEEYLTFITKVAPTHIVAYRLSQELYKEKIAQHDLFSFASHYTPLNLKVDKQKKYAENHLHLKGSSYSPFNMLMLFSYKTDEKYFKDEFLKKIPRINEFTFINNHTFSIRHVAK